MYLEVVFNLPVKKSFTYLTEEGRECPAGVRVVAPFGGRDMTGFVVGTGKTGPDGSYTVKPVKRIIDAEPVFGAEELEIARWMAELYLCSLGEALSAMIPSGRREREIAAFETAWEAPRGETLLSPEQEEAVRGILSGEHRFNYLFGVTGSGKTEVFLRAAGRVIQEGRSVVYLVPEISLTHQLVQEVQHRFAGITAVLHSRLTPSQRLEQWKKITSGEAMFVIGARSAVFAPARNPGLYVIDEEHEGSYKSSSAPRYHARQVAMKLAGIHGAALVMGSATPSAEAYHLIRTGTIQAYRLTRRLSGGSMPSIEIIDMRGQNGPLSRRLIEELKAAAAEGRQSILFLNRRGFSYFFHCRSCGYEMKCSRCSVALTYHKRKNRMVCHYCGYSRAPMDVCPECGSLDVGYAGFGTEMIEETVRKTFPDLTVARADTDAVKRKGALETLISDFRSGQIDILLGTQMVAKGLNFPGVKLVGIVLADTTLHLPDFRAAERTFSLITQVSGRAGRFFPDGRVVIQTYSPTHDSIRLAAEGDLEAFYAAELDIRRELGFPPFSRLFRLVFRGKDTKKVREAAGEVAAGLRNALQDQAEVLGAAECPISVIAGNLRLQIIMRTGEFDGTHYKLKHVLDGTRIPRGVFVEVDVDPVSLL